MSHQPTLCEVELNCAPNVLQILTRSKNYAFAFCNHNKHEKRPRLLEDAQYLARSFAEGTNVVVVRLVVVVLVAIIEVQFPRVRGTVLRG